jgi:hypothetical protein
VLVLSDLVYLGSLLLFQLEKNKNYRLSLKNARKGAPSFHLFSQNNLKHDSMQGHIQINAFHPSSWLSVCVTLPLAPRLHLLAQPRLFAPLLAPPAAAPAGQPSTTVKAASSNLSSIVAVFLEVGSMALL